MIQGTNIAPDNRATYICILYGTPWLTHEDNGLERGPAGFFSPSYRLIFN